MCNLVECSRSLLETNYVKPNPVQHINNYSDKNRRLATLRVINAILHAVNTLLEYPTIWSMLRFINKTLPIVYCSIRSIVANCKRVAEHPADEVFATFIGFSKAGSICSRIFTKPRSIYQRIFTQAQSI